MVSHHGENAIPQHHARQKQHLQQQQRCPAQDPQPPQPPQKHERQQIKGDGKKDDQQNKNTKDDEEQDNSATRPLELHHAGTTIILTSSNNRNSPTTPTTTTATPILPQHKDNHPNPISPSPTLVPLSPQTTLQPPPRPPRPSPSLQLQEGNTRQHAQSYSQPEATTATTSTPSRSRPPCNLLRPQHPLHILISTLLHRFRHGLIAILLVVLSQFVIWGLDRLVKLASKEFPPAIVGMVLVFLIMYWTNKIVPEVEGWYVKVLGQAANLVNRHMSIGFTVPFVQALNLKFRDPRHIGVAVGCFCVTGILSSVLMYFLALLMERTCSGLRRKSKGDVESEGHGHHSHHPVTLPIQLGRSCSRNHHHHHSNGHTHRHASHGHHQHHQHHHEEADYNCLGVVVPRSDSGIQMRTLLTVGANNNSSKYLSGTSTISQSPSSFLATTDHESDTVQTVTAVPSPIPSRVPSPIPEDSARGGNIGNTINNAETSLSPNSPLSEPIIQQRPLRQPSPPPRRSSSPASTTSSFPPSRYSHLLHNNLPPFLISILLIPFLAIPLALTTSHTTPLDTLILFSLWFGTQSLQSLLLTSPPRWLHLKKGLHGGVIVLLNAVLLSSLCMMAYIKLKTLITSQSLEDTLAEFVTRNTLADIISRGGDGHGAGMGAGDIATAILDAGIVVWGLKLFECRNQLLSHAGITVTIISAIAATANFFLGPMLGHAMGLDATEALAFAARSVTLALGSPVIENLGGNVTINAAMVVLNGLVFQICGDWMFERLGLADDGMAGPSGSSATVDGVSEGRDGEDGAVEGRPQEQLLDTGGCGVEEHKLVAAGVTVGINAAAMGTAHLYERCSGAAPYAALSMTVIGVVTVIVAAIRPASEFIVGYVS